MTAISNFTQAVRELTGFGDNNQEGDSPVTEEITEVKAIKAEKEVKVWRKPAEFELREFDTDGGSLITRSMSIMGQMECSNLLKVEGKVSGEIKAENAVSVTGLVIGNVNANNISVMGKIKGSIAAQEVARVDSAAVLVGDIHADNLYVYGRVKGNLTVKDTTEVAADALIVGDIVTGSLASSRGSIIDGKITIKDKDKKPFNFDEESLFKIEE